MANEPEQPPRRLQREMVRAERERRATEDVVLRVPRTPSQSFPPYERADRRGSAAGLSLMLAVLSLLLLAVIGVLITRQRYLQPQIAADPQPAIGWIAPPSVSSPSIPIPVVTPRVTSPAAQPTPAASAPEAPAVPLFPVPGAPAPLDDPSTGTDTTPTPSPSVAPDDGTTPANSGEPSSGTALPNDGLTPSVTPTTPIAPAPSSGLPDPATPNAPPSTNTPAPSP